jgi:hypothetical protein
VLHQKVLRKYYHLINERDGGDNYIMSFVICDLHVILLALLNKEE